MAGPPVAGAVPSPVIAPARRVFVVILDGLRDDVGETLPVAHELGQRGVRRVVRSEYPAVTYPNVTTMTTGVIPLYSGVRLNGWGALRPIDSLFAAAARAGVPSVVAHPGEDSLDDALDPRLAPPAEHATLDAVLARPPRHEIVWVHMTDVDEAGHWHGAKSPAYRQAALALDGVLGRIAARFDPTKDVLIALADHGHRDQGGHGGMEPEVVSAYFLALGWKIPVGVRLAPAPMRNVCATIALLSGVPIPVANQGTPMLELLSLSPEERLAAVTAIYAQRSSLLRAEGEPAGDRFDEDAIVRGLAAASPGAADAALASLARRGAAEEERVARRYSRVVRNRLIVAGVLLTVLISLAFWWARRANATSLPKTLRLADALPLFVYAPLFVILMALRGYPFSWSLPRGLPPFFLESAAASILAGAAALLIPVPGRPRGTDRRRTEQALMIVPVAAGYLFLAIVVGVDATWLAPPRLGFAMVALACLIEGYCVVFGVAALVEGRRARLS